MIELSKLPITELAAVICESLKKAGVKATLSGGACAEIYSKSKYVSVCPRTLGSRAKSHAEPVEGSHKRVLQLAQALIFIR